MTGRAKHAERSHKTQHRNASNNKYFQASNAMRVQKTQQQKQQRSIVEKLMGLIKKGDR